MINIALFAVIIVVLIAISSLSPGVPRSLKSFVSGESVGCADAPYNPNCACTIDREKITSAFKYFCITHSPKSTIDCDWCNRQCLEWQNVWQQYPSPELYNAYCTDRMPVESYACVARLSESSELECLAESSIQTPGLEFFCNEDSVREIITEWQGTDEELVGFFKSKCPVPGVNPIDNCELIFSGASGGGRDMQGEPLSVAECRSACYDSTGRLVGGHVILSAVWYTSNRQIVGNIAAGSYTSNCINGV